MRLKNKNVNRIFIFLALCTLSSIIVGVTTAAFVKKLESRANCFTFGNLSIKLEEPTWDTLSPDDKITYPGREINKDPTLTNTGKTDAYLYLEVRVPRESVSTVANNETINGSIFTDLFSYNINSGWKQIGNSQVSEDGKFSIYVYAYMEQVRPKDKTTPLFDKVTFAPVLEGDLEMKTQLSISISATGIQTGYLNEAGTTLEEKIIDAYRISKLS